MPTWLNSQKKARLAELAAICQIGTPTDLAEWRKDQLVPALEQVLSTNLPIYGRNPVFDEYYQRRNSPIKRGGGANRGPIAPPTLVPMTNGEVNAMRDPARRTASTPLTEPSSDEPVTSPPHGVTPSTFTALPAPSPAMAQTPAARPVHTIPRTTTFQPSTSSTFQPAPPTPASALINRTPARLQELQRDESGGTVVPLPPSPAIVTDLIEAQTARLNAEVSEMWASTRVMDIMNQIRVELSSMVGVHMAILLLEFYFLQAHVAEWHYAFDLTTPLFTKAIFYPDLFVYLSGHWWSMLLTWQAMSFWIPLVVSWFCNLSLKLKTRNDVEYWRPKYRVDPLTFSVTKALVAWLVFAQGKQFWGLVAPETILRIEAAMPVGHQGIMVASYVGIAMAVWDGIQGKKGWQ